MRSKKLNIVLISIFLVIVGILILYVNPSNPINRLLFFISISFASTIPLLKRKKKPGASLYYLSRYAIWLFAIVLFGGINIYLFLFSEDEHDLVAYIGFIAFIAMVVLFIIKVRRDTNLANKQNNAGR